MQLLHGSQAKRRKLAVNEFVFFGPGLSVQLPWTAGIDACFCHSLVRPMIP